MQRDAALDPRAVGLGRKHQVLDAHVGEGAAHHDFMVAAARAVAVEVGLDDAVVDQVLAGGRGVLDRAGRRNVVGRDRVAEDAERACLGDRRRGARRHREAVEERRLGDVGGLRPVVHLAVDALDLLPELARILLDLAVVGGEGFPVHRVFHERVDLVGGRPDVADPHVLAVLALAERLRHQVLHHRAGDRVGHHQRRRGEEVRLEVGVDPRLEVAVARQHGGAYEVVLDDRLVDLGDRSPALPMQVVQP